jgi:hypothetical protein
MANKKNYTYLSTGEQVESDFVDVGSSNYAPQVAIAAGSAAMGSLTAGETHIGSVGGHSAISTVAIAMTTHATYAANDFVGTDGTPLTFAGCARVNAGSGVIVGATLIDYALQSVAGELWLFDTTFTPPADSAAWTLSDAHAALCIGVIPFSTYYASALNSVSVVNNLGMTFVCGAASKSLFGAFVTRGAPAYASGDLTIRLRILQD